MSIATVITILSVINALLSVAKDAPAVIDEAKSLLAKVEPHVATATTEVKQQFATAQAVVAKL